MIDRHEEITRYIRMRHMYCHPMVMRVLLTFSASFVNPGIKTIVAVSIHKS